MGVEAVPIAGALQPRCWSSPPFWFWARFVGKHPLSGIHREYIFLEFRLRLLRLGTKSFKFTSAAHIVDRGSH